jgi:DNA ligase (NAD+)
VIKESRTGSETPIHTPEVCPSCGTLVKKDDDKVRYYCPNHALCPEQVKQKLINSVGKDGLDID